MSDIRTMLEDTATKIMKDHCTKDVVMDAEKGIWPAKLWNSLEETGMTLVGISEEVGGTGGDIGDALSLFKIAGKYSAPIPLAENFLGNWLLSYSGLPVINNPVTIAPVSKKDTFIFTKKSNGWLIDGIGHYIPWANDVGKIILYGKTVEGSRIVSYVDVDICDIYKGENLSGEPRNEVIVKNKFVPDDNTSLELQFSESDFWNVSTITRVVLMAGALERVLELTIAYSNERTQFGREIGKFQAVKHQLAVMAGEVVASSAVSDYIIDAFDQGNINQEIAMAKIQLGEASNIVSKIAHQVLGAMGFTNEHSLQLSTRRLWSWRDEYGAESELAYLLGEQILAAGSKNLWPMITSY